MTKRKFKEMFKGNSWKEIVLSLRPHNRKNQSQIAKETDKTYLCVHIVICELEKKGLVSRLKSGRETLCYLTKKGHEIADHLDAIEIIIRRR